MFRIFYASKDTTLYERYTDYNTGLDEILEIGKRLDNEGSTLLKSRSLIKFDMTEISASLSKYSKTVNDCKFVLNLYTSHAKNLPSEYTVQTKLVGQDWVNGTGFLSALTIDGANWSGSASGSAWISGSQYVNINSSSLYISGSGAGGNYLYYSGSGNTLSLIASESFSYRTSDININVTDAIKIWISGDVLQIKIIYTKTKPTYKDTEISKIRIYVRDKYPQKSPTNLFPIQTVKYLPTTTCYSVLDAATDEVIIPYDNIYTKVSCDSTSNYIYLDMNVLMPERNYRLNFKIVDGFTEQYIDNQIYFKVIR